ncbi:carboxypeptidase-like regulatory domain-containing protein [Flavobacterium sp. MFBS3-15]|uniref:carboxypeptidase-like regulatory domain-containing protein n=1 Tax=Flavobacterium sp. MFBS3-15 TaxID=2989816 RepID=UPI002236B368|nr:carboxypeptidase-like regulatory domain-containing protein [Flavobacterium sp. MFBS3-15]MCW4467578.1 carboxypeptidase-like regulatory domain-containing protein [Flavobacterium sp. MFBS3-15]
MVTDYMGMPLPSVNVKLQGAKVLPVQTNFDGEFTIMAKEDDRLEFSYIGLKTQVITVSEKHAYKIMLQDDIIDTGLVIYAKYSGRLRGVAATYMFNYD